MASWTVMRCILGVGFILLGQMSFAATACYSTLGLFQVFVSESVRMYPRIPSDDSVRIAPSIWIHSMRRMGLGSSIYSFEQRAQVPFQHKIEVEVVGAYTDDLSRTEFSTPMKFHPELSFKSGDQNLIHVGGGNSYTAGVVQVAGKKHVVFDWIFPYAGGALIPRFVKLAGIDGFRADGSVPIVVLEGLYALRRLGIREGELASAELNHISNIPANLQLWHKILGWRLTHKKGTALLDSDLENMISELPFVKLIESTLRQSGHTPVAVHVSHRAAEVQKWLDSNSEVVIQRRFLQANRLIVGNWDRKEVAAFLPSGFSQFSVYWKLAATTHTLGF